MSRNKVHKPRTSTGPTKLDIACEKVVKMMNEEAAAKNKMKPILDKKLKEIQKIDNKIKWFEDKIKELESDKQFELNRMDDLLDLAMQSSHSLSNGYTVMPDNKAKVEVLDVAAFLKWLKQNREPQDVLDFFSDALKKANLKKFCDKEMNNQTEKGILEPKIDGIRFGEITYRRLTTLTKKVK